MRPDPTPDQEEPPATRHNFRMLVGDVSCFFVGMAFLDTTTALPAVLRLLGGNAAVLGTLLALRQGAYFLPQIVVAHRLQGRERYKAFLLRVCFLGRIWLFGAALAVYLCGATMPALALALLSAAYIFSWIGDGAGGVPWTSMVGRMIPARRRGRLFATTQVVSGISRLAVSAAVGALLSTRFLHFPANAALLVLCCAVFLGLSWVFLAALREPPPPEQAETPPAVDGFLRYVGRLPERFRQRPDFALLALAQVLGTAAGASMPFLVGYAARTEAPATLPAGLTTLFSGGGGGGLAGLFLATQTLGLLCFAPCWGMVNDRLGPRTTLAGTFFVALLCPISALLGGILGGNLVLFLAAYFCFGAVQDGWVTVTNYLLEAIPEAERPTYIGLMNAASAPSLILPFAAGLIVRGVGAPVMFAGAAVLLALGFVVAVRLPETRRRSLAARTVQSG